MSRKLFQWHILPDCVFSELCAQIELPENNTTRHNSNLAGNIENEYFINNMSEGVVEYIESCASEYYGEDVGLDGMWTNIQKKYEYNPVHDHTGDVSFVCWIKLPYDLKEEQSLPNSVNSESPSNTLFSLLPVVDGKLDIHKFNPTEGTCLFFEASTHHVVYPFFTSDDVRISVAGNLSLINP